MKLYNTARIISFAIFLSQIFGPLAFAEKYVLPLQKSQGKNYIGLIKGTWEPVSTVYSNFGNMTIKDNLIYWASGQKSSFRIISQNQREIILELTARDLPKLHGDIYKFIKFSFGGDVGWNEMEVRFYEPSDDLNKENAMWGVYVRPDLPSK